MLLATAMLFGLSGFLVFFIIGSSYLEKKMISGRVKRLREDEVKVTKDTTERVKKISFSTQDKRRQTNVQLEASSFLIIGASIIVTLVLAVLLPMPGLNKLIFILVLPILTYRILRLITLKQYLEQMERSLPGALDLIVVCLEAGLGINAAFHRVAGEMAGTPLGKELKQMVNEISAGIPMDDALRAFSKRTRVEETSAMVTAVIQAEKLGSSIATTFRVQADTMRERYKMKVKERIQKIPIKILFPLVFFIFPALFVVVLGPALISVLQVVGA